MNNRAHCVLYLLPSSDCADGDCATYTRVMNAQVRAILFASGEVAKALMFKPLKGQCCHTDRCNKPLVCSAGTSSKADQPWTGVRLGLRPHYGSLKVFKGVR